MKMNFEKEMASVLKQAMAESRRRGKAEEKLEVAMKMMETGFDFDEIYMFTGMRREEIMFELDGLISDAKQAHQQEPQQEPAKQDGRMNEIDEPWTDENQDDWKTDSDDTWTHVEPREMRPGLMTKEQTEDMRPELMTKEQTKDMMPELMTKEQTKDMRPELMTKEQTKDMMPELRVMGQEVPNFWASERPRKSGRGFHKSRGVVWGPVNIEELLAETGGSKTDGSAMAVNEELKEALIVWRREQFRAEGVRAYMVMPQRTLLEIARKIPKTRDELMAIYGFGDARWEKYGERILEITSGF